MTNSYNDIINNTFTKATHTIAREVVKRLISIDAVTLSPNRPYTWSSGMKSPIYCDNRLIISYPTIRKFISKCLVKMIEYHFPEAEVIAGTSTAGIPHASWVSAVLEKPMVYVRSSAKSHGLHNSIEGVTHEGQKVVIVEDLISTGGSSITCAKALREAKCEVIGVAAIFTYELPQAAENFEKYGNIKNITLSNYSTLLEVALEEGIIKESDLTILREWNKNPLQWGQ